jgi:hypothetical protein
MARKSAVSVAVVSLEPSRDDGESIIATKGKSDQSTGGPRPDPSGSPIAGGRARQERSTASGSGCGE